MIRAVIDDVVSTFSPKLDSHKTGWARMQRCMVQDTFDHDPRDWAAQDNKCVILEPKQGSLVVGAKTWLVSHAMEFTGKGYNIFGGWSETTRERVLRVADLKDTALISLERPMPNLEALLRAGASKTKFDLTEAEWAQVRLQCMSTPTVTHTTLLRWAGHAEPDVVLGDSHSVAHYMRGRLVLRNDGLTLHGMLKRGLYEMLRQADVTWRVPKLTICAGNIDIRHHLMRQANPDQATKELVRELKSQIDYLMRIGAIDSCEIVTPLPIEHEARRIPGSGCYKGTPFYGSAKDRSALAAVMSVEMQIWFGSENLYQWPESWYMLDREEYASRYMEKPSSVHLSPRRHRWDYIANQPNEALAEEYAR